MSYSPEHPSDKWTRINPYTEEVAYVRRELNGVPFLSRTFQLMLDGLTEGGSRTVYALPVNVHLREGPAAMLYAARRIRQLLELNNLADIDPMRMPFEVRLDELPEQFGEPTIPVGIKAGLDPEAPIGFVRTEYEDFPRLCVGSLDRQEHTVTVIDL